MTTTYHTAIPSTPAQPANAAIVNSPLSELDSELVAQDGRITVLEADMPVPSGVASEYFDGSGGFSVPSGTGSTNGHVIQDEGVDQTQRVKLNFTGAGVTVVDTPSATEVQIAVSDHGALTGLLDADHVAGSIAFTATDKLVGRSTSGAGAGEEIPLTAAGRALIAAASVADQRTLLEIKDTAYKLVPTIASNNITLTLTHMDGTTPSTGRPLWFRIADDWRAVVGALSVTVNAAVNTFNAGSAELATKEIDYFPYVSWRAASSEVVLGFSRIPFASLYSDFSGTATNETYAAFSTAPASTDDVANIGRFAATLSAGGGYTWTVPTFTNSSLKNQPEYDTRLLTYTPIWASSGTAVSLGNSSIAGTYRISMRTVVVRVEFTAGNTATFGTGIYTWTVPFMPVSNSYGAARILDSGTAHHTLTSDVLSAGNVLRGYPNNAANVGATSPMTWTASDELRAQINLEI